MSDIDTSPTIVASVDLGSNSFHMLVARVDENNNLVMIDQLKEMVRLREGLDENNALDSMVAERALACLNRFGERIRHLPSDAVRIAGTNTLRTMKNANDFIALGNEALGHNIEIISGHEEARLIYLGVAHSLSSDRGSQMVVDIGGGSTEFIIGKGFEPSCLDSLNIGSVSITQRYFPNGRLDAKLWDKAITDLKLGMTPLQKDFDNTQWSLAIGASGTIKAAKKIIVALELDQFSIDLAGLHHIRDKMIEAGHIDNLVLPGLKSDRAPVFSGGLAILIALFETFAIEEMVVSDGALREGLLYDLLGRRDHEDVREVTVQKMMKRFDVDAEHVNQITETALHLFDQVKESWQLNDNNRLLLRWAAQLHEMGMSIDHSSYNEHGAYILRHAYMPGFSRREQVWLSVLTKTHRKKLHMSAFDDFLSDERERLLRGSLLLRLTKVFHRSRKNEAVLPTLTGKPGNFNVEWTGIAKQSMLEADLNREKNTLSNLGITLDFN